MAEESKPVPAEQESNRGSIHPNPCHLSGIGAQDGESLPGKCMVPVERGTVSSDEANQAKFA